MGKFRGLGWSAALVLMLSSVAGSGYGQGTQRLFKYKGKVYDLGQLSPARQNQLYEIELEHYQKIKQVVEQAMLDVSLMEEAKKKSEDVEKLKSNRFRVDTPTDKEVGEWYEQNKARIPYPLDKVKAQITSYLMEEKRQTKLREAIDKLVAAKDNAFLLNEPAAPRFKIASDGFPSKGNKSAKVTIVEFADYQCPHCRKAFESFKDVFAKNKDRINFVYMDFPINHSGISRVVAEGAVCADEQGKFWEFHSLAFEKQAELSKESPKAFAKDLKLDEAKFESCMQSDRPKKKVDAAKAEGERLGVTGTPSIYINGARYLKSHDVEAINEAIDSALKG